MQGQWSSQLVAYGTPGRVGLQSFHFDFPAELALVQISLSTRADNSESGMCSFATACFTEYTTAEGVTHYFSADDCVSTFVATNLTSFSGYLAVGGCWAEAVISVFIWPSIHSSDFLP